MAELAVVGLPSILVPLPGAPGDHQSANGRTLADVGAAVLVRDDELDGPRLRQEVEQLLDEPDRRIQMAEAAARMGRPDAPAAIIDLVETYARRPPSTEPLTSGSNP